MTNLRFRALGFRDGVKALRVYGLLLHRLQSADKCTVRGSILVSARIASLLRVEGVELGSFQGSWSGV